MIWNVVRVGLLRLRHSPSELALTFVLPIVFFSIFALIFDQQVGTGKANAISVIVVDEDRSELSDRLVSVLDESDSMRLNRHPDTDERVFDDRAEVTRLVQQGKIALAIVIPADWSQAATTGQPTTSPLEIVADTSDPVAPKIAMALLQQAATELVMGQRKQGPPVPIPDALDPPPTAKRDVLLTNTAAVSTATASFRPIEVEIVDLLAEDKANPVVTMYAAGIAVMFMLFGATGNGGSLLDEEQNQTLERLMSSHLNMTQLLFGKWLLIWLIAVLQVCVMFAWAQLSFGVDVLGHVAGFLVMTAVTAAAASSFALVLATACKTRGQLNAVSVILILTMSALGGSMVPRYIMSEQMQQFGRFTFNAWALDGYNKVFWRDLPITDLGPEVAVLGASAVLLLIVARLLARRWEQL